MAIDNINLIKTNLNKLNKLKILITDYVDAKSVIKNKFSTLKKINIENLNLKNTNSKGDNIKNNEFPDNLFDLKYDTLILNMRLSMRENYFKDWKIYKNTQNIFVNYSINTIHNTEILNLSFDFPENINYLSFSNNTVPNSIIVDKLPRNINFFEISKFSIFEIKTENPLFIKLFYYDKSLNKHNLIANNSQISIKSHYKKLIASNNKNNKIQIISDYNDYDKNFKKLLENISNLFNK